MIAGVVLTLSSCTTLTRTASTTNVQTGVHQYPTVADLDIKDKVENTLEWNFRPFHIGEPSLTLAKGNLIAETLKKHDADILLEPQFIFTKSSFGIRRLVVTGFPAKFKDFRKATDQDLKALEAGGKTNVRTVYNIANKKSILKILGIKK